MQGRVKFFVLSSETAQQCWANAYLFSTSELDRHQYFAVVHPNTMIDHKQEKYKVETKQI